jgi:hypothetical protein
MSLQSTTALATSLLHDGSGDGSSLEETSRSPAFRLLIRLSFRSRLVISRSLCCALRVACRLSEAALFRLKIASSRSGALAGTRCAHLSCNDKKTEGSFGVGGLREDQHHNEEHRSTEIYPEDGDLQISQSPHGRASGVATPAATSRTPSQSPAPRVAGPQAATGRPERSWSPSRGAVGHHLAEMKRPPPERHNSSGMVLPEDVRQGHPGSSEMPQHRPVILEDLLLIRLRGAVRPVPS